MYQSILYSSAHHSHLNLGIDSFKLANRLVFKPNMTINSAAKKYARFPRLLLLSHEYFTIETSHINPEQGRLIRNYFGSDSEKNTPDLIKYASWFKDFQVKVSLFNHTNHFERDIYEFKNPYFKGEKATQEENRLCFNSAVAKNGHSRCLQI